MNIDDIKKVKEMTDLGLKEEDIQAYLNSDRTKTVEEFINSLDSHNQHLRDEGNAQIADMMKITDSDVDHWVDMKNRGLA